MKRLLKKILTHPEPLRSVLVRRLRDWRRPPTYLDRLATGELLRPNYAYCIFQAARLAVLLGYPRISVAEFGCGGGNGLLDAEMHIREVGKILPIDIELYGFDLGSGLPEPQDYRDMPYYFRRGLYPMDRPSLDAKLDFAKLVVGDVKDTCRTFFKDYEPAPIGCIFYDLDFYSATCDALSLLDADPGHFLPRIFMYFDDTIGDEIWLCNDYTGERAAIDDFNKSHAKKKISKCYYMPLYYPEAWWAHQIYAYHDFDHPRYNDFIGQQEQVLHSQLIKLRQA